MMKTCEETITLRPRDCDLNDAWRPSSILASMQDISAEHALLLGCGREELLKKNIVWVLSRMELHMDRYPRGGEQIKLVTFPTPTRLSFFPRYYIMTDAHGEMIGKAGSLWLLMDIQTRRLMPAGDVARLIPDNRDLSVPMRLPAAVGALQGEEFVSTVRPLYTDLDVNGHVNNTRYADWLCNAMGIDMMRRFELESIIINYNHEVLPEQTVTLRRILRGNEFRLQGESDGKVAFEIGGLLRERITGSSSPN